MEGTFDVIVIGGGIMGSCTAYEVAKLGHSVLLLEQFDFLHHLGSSHGESRTIRATYPEHFYTDMVIRAYHLWDQAEEEAGYRVIIKTPQFDIGPADNHSLQLAIANCKKSNINVRVLGKEDVAEEFSGVFSLPEGWIGVATELGGIIKPTKAVAMFQSLALKHGAVLKDHSKVTGISKDDQSGIIRVSAADGTAFDGKKCVVTAGAWTNKLIESITGQAIPIEPLQPTISYWKISDTNNNNKSLFTPDSGFPTFAGYGFPFIYGTPSHEFPGLIKIALHGGHNCDPDARHWETDMELLRTQVKPWIEKVFPGHVEAETPVSTQSCMYSMTPDNDYVIDYIGGSFGKDLVVAGGFSGHGFKVGPLVGKIVAEMVLGVDQIEVEMSQFRIGRFFDNPKGNLKDHEEPVSLHARS